MSDPQRPDLALLVAPFSHTARNRGVEILDRLEPDLLKAISRRGRNSRRRRA